MRTHRRVVILTLAITLLMTLLAVPAQAGPAGTLLSKINSARAGAGLPPLETYWDITDNARAHTNRMIDEQRVFHSSNLGGATNVWEGIAENVGMHFSVDELHAAFMASSGHRANILGNFNYVGIGAKEDENGNVWATVIFMRAAPGLNDDPDDTTTTTAAPTTTTTQPAVQIDPGTTTTTAPTTTTTVAPSEAGNQASNPAPSASAGTKGEAAVTKAFPAVEIVEPLGHPDSATIAD